MSLPTSNLADCPGEPGVVRIRLDIAYDGTGFSGWAVQPQRRTVQGVLQEGLAIVLRLPAELTVAGRTDAGVHAIGQVAHLDLPTTTWVAASPTLLRRLAGVLPADVRVRAAVEVPAQFDARFSAVWRRYEYRISDAVGGVDPLRRWLVLGWPRALDAEAMAAAACSVVGEHDFAAFCKFREGATTVRTVYSLQVQRAGDEIVCTVQADAFCHAMVRSLVGSLLAVGDGRRDATWLASLLTRTSRADEVPVAPPHGLTLVAVGYPPEGAPAERAAVTRQWRT